MKRPVLWVTGSLTAATALAATLLIVTATRGNGRPEFQRPAAIGAPAQFPSDCRPAHCDRAQCAPTCRLAD
jgi:hypothetical protein